MVEVTDVELRKKKMSWLYFIVLVLLIVVGIFYQYEYVYFFAGIFLLFETIKILGYLLSPSVLRISITDEKIQLFSDEVMIESCLHQEVQHMKLYKEEVILKLTEKRYVFDSLQADPSSWEKLVLALKQIKGQHSSY